MRIKSRLSSLEKSIKTTKKKEYLTLLWLEDEKTSYKGKDYTNFTELLKDYPNIEDNYNLCNINIVRA